MTLPAVAGVSAGFLSGLGLVFADILDGVGLWHTVVAILLYPIGGVIYGLIFGYIGTLPFIGMAWLASRVTLAFPRQILFLINGAVVGLIVVYSEQGGFIELDALRQSILLIACLLGGACAGYINEHFASRTM